MAELEGLVISEDDLRNLSRFVTEGEGNEGEPTEIETQIQSLLEKQESELTDDERKLLDANKDIVEKLVKKDDEGGEGDEGEDNDDNEPGILDGLAKEEGFIEEAKKYEDSSEGITQYLKDRDQKRDLKVITSFLSAHPEVAKVYNHVVVEGKPFSSFMKQTDKPEILELKLADPKANDTEDVKKQLIDDHIKVIRQGLRGKVSQTVLEAMISTAIEKGETLSMAKDILKDVEKEYNAEVQRIEAEAENRMKYEQEMERARVQTIKELINAGSLASNIVVPQSERLDFYDFLVKPIDPNTKETKYDKTLNSLTNEEDMLLDYLVYLKAKKGKIELNDVKYKTTVKKFFKDTKEKNNDRKPPIKGGGKGSGDFVPNPLDYIPNRIN